MKKSVLFVCLGNICRSPTAEGVFTKMVDEAGLMDRIQIDSAGTGGWHVGEPPDARAQVAAKKRGYELQHLRARQALPGDFYQFDYILAMDDENLRNLRLLCEQKDHLHKAELLLNYAKNFTEKEVPDPYYGGDEGFSHVLDLIEDACSHLLQQIQTELK